MTCFLCRGGKADSAVGSVHLEDLADGHVLAVLHEDDVLQRPLLLVDPLKFLLNIGMYFVMLNSCFFLYLFC